MAEGNKDTRKRFGRRGRDRGDRRSEPKPKVPDMPAVMCSMCGKQIFDLSSALAGQSGADPVHFDCTLARMAETEQLGPNEKIAYIGRGAFAVVEYRDRSMTAFTVKRRVQWEKEGEKYEWRRAMQQRIGL